ncbi:MAG: DUF551 domain-containing protein [Pasteurellaceae bacterium]|nr:DUF551 domain-containing protein [Pasteurellaceae bacterium]
MSKENNGWISVEERQPENEQMILTYRNSFKRGDLFTQAIYIEGKGFIQYQTGYVGKQPTHWQPLPEPPTT